MKKSGIIVLVLVLSVYLVGCGKKQHNPEQALQEPVSMETLSAIGTEQKAAPEVKPVEVKAPEAKVSTTTIQTEASVPPEPKLEPLPPSGPYKPTLTEIQTALKNAGFYNGKVDGKSGPMTKKAVEEFQNVNGLKADGKVGPRTWSLLSKNLNTAPVKEVITPAAKKR